MRPAGPVLASIVLASTVRAGLLLAGFILGAVLAVAACSGPPPRGAAPRATYYLALGDSLSQGVQPDAAGVSVKTPDGYPDQLYAALRPGHPGLRLVKLGCPGETTGTMMKGGICGYRGGSQLAAATAFLRAHRGRVLLVTLDIGANDPEACGARPGLATLASCFVTSFPGAVSRLTAIVAALRAAAGPGVRIAGMNYYLPALAEWRNGLPGHMIAWTAEKLAATYNALLDRVYAKAGVRVADVFAAFDTGNFAAGPGAEPRNVALLCRWTWACAAPPRGPNQHANQAGYQVIARAFRHAAGLR